MSAPRLLTLEEGLALLRVSTATYYRRPDLPRAFRVGGQRRFRESDIVAWVDQQVAAAASGEPEADPPLAVAQ